MRTDDKLEQEVAETADTDNQDEPSVWAGLISGASFSGHERNHLFLRMDGEGYPFADVSPISGLDHPGDSRAFALLDHDRDGWTDIAVVNANTPMLQLFRNRIGDAGAAAKRKVLALRLVGGQREARASERLSARDACGARVRIDLGDRVLTREHACGGGMAAQNSATMLIGLGEKTGVEGLEVRWPSGQISRLDRLPADRLVTIHEGEGHELAPYRRKPTPAGRPEHLAAGERFELPGTGDSQARLRVFTTMATWCESCRRELPLLADLRQRFGEDELELFGVPVDVNDTEEMLEAYSESLTPAYRLLSGLPAEQREQVRELVLERLRTEALPTSIITDRNGEVIRFEWGVPTVSALRHALYNEAP